MAKVYLLLGGNKGNRLLYLKTAEKLVGQHIGLIQRKSSVYETEPWRLTGVPSFLNQVFIASTLLTPEEVLGKIWKIEKKLGRSRNLINPFQNKNELPDLDRRIPGLNDAVNNGNKQKDNNYADKAEKWKAYAYRIGGYPYPGQLEEDPVEKYTGESQGAEEPEKDPERTNYSSRTIDIDILLYDDMIITKKDLIVPHPLLHKRRFTLEPLAELDGGLSHPVFKKSIAILLAGCEDNLIVRPLKNQTP